MSYHRSALDCAPLESLELSPGARVAVMGPTGDEALALAARGMAVTCVVSRVRSRALVELKLAAARSLAPAACREFLGLGLPGRRVFYYHVVREALSPSARRIWDDGEATLRAGLLVEEARFCRALRALLGSAAVQRLCSCDDLDRQAAVVEEHWNRRRVALLARALLSPLVRRRLDEVMAHHENRSNYLLRWLLEGTLREPERGPPHLTDAGLQALATADVQIASQLSGGSWDAVVVAEPVDFEAVVRSGARRVVAWDPPGLRGIALDEEATRCGRALDRTLVAERFTVLCAG